MADLFDTSPATGLLPTAGAAVGNPRRGRPKGSTNKRSGDLQAILVHTYGGRTPGQQLAQVCMVTPAEVRKAKGRARELGLTAELMAMIEKAERLAQAMGWPGQQGVKDAWAMMYKAYGELLPYVHQRLAPKEAEKGAQQLPMILMDPEPAGGAALPSSFGNVEEDQPLIEVLPLQLSQPNSHD